MTTKATATAPAVRCEACRRRPDQIQIGRLSPAQVNGIAEMTYLCTDVADCRRHR